MKYFTTLTIAMMVVCLMNCGTAQTSSSSVVTTATSEDTTNSVASLTQLATKFGTVAGALVPSLNATDADASVSNYLINGTTDTWSQYVSEDNFYLVSDIFGSETEAPQVVTKIRVLLDQFGDDIASIANYDPEFSCMGNAILSAEDTVAVAFYGEIDNGTAADRYYDCIIEEEGNTTLYGQDAVGVIRIVKMSEWTGDVEEENQTLRGSTSQGMQVVMTAYAEGTSDAGAVSLLDLQYAQATLYPGADETHGTDDDVVFKSRSRITGQAVLNDEGAIASAQGDFMVTKYDEGVNSDNTPWEMTTQTAGRGSYGADEFSLFHIDTSASSITDNDQIFCLQQQESALPQAAEAFECEDLESVYAWEISFPFSLTPEIDLEFSDQALFESADLISNDGSNFSIPTYDSTPVAATEIE